MTILLVARFLAIGMFATVGFAFSVDWHSIVEGSRVGGDEDVTVAFIGREINNFREAMQRERSLLELPLTVEPLYRETDDFYFDDHIWQTDSPNQLQLSSLALFATTQLRSAVVQMITVTIATTGENCVMLATTREVTVTCYGLKGRTRTSSSAFEGVLSVAGMNEDNVDSNTGQLIAYVLHEVEDSNQRVTWWDVFNETQSNGDGGDWLQLGTLSVDAGATFLNIVPVHVTDSYMLAVGGRYAIEMYVIGAGGSFVIPCTRLEAINATDLASFHINGQLYVVVASSLPGASVLWKYDSYGDIFLFHHGLDDDAIEDVEYFRYGHEHYLATVGPGEASMYRWVGSRLLRIQQWDRSTAASHPVWHCVCQKRTSSEANAVVLLLATDEGVALYTWDDHQKLFVAFVDTECIRWEKRSESPVGSTVMYTDSDVRDFCVEETRCEGIATGEDGAELPIGVVGDKTFVTYRSFVQKVTGSVEQCWPSPTSNIQLASFSKTDSSPSVIMVASATTVRVLHAYFDNGISKTNDNAQIERLETQLEKQRISLQETREMLDRISVEHTRSAINPSKLKNSCPDMPERQVELGKQLQFAETQLLSLLENKNTIHVRGDVRLKSLTVTGDVKLKRDSKIDIINSVNVTKLLKESVVNGQFEKIGGVKTFNGEISIKGPIRVGKLFNGGRILQDFLMLDRLQSTRGVTEFKAPVTISGNFNVANHVNGIDLVSEVIQLDDVGTHLVTARKTFLDVLTVDDEVVLGGSVNGLKPSVVAANTVTSLTSPKTQRISGIKTFTQAKVIGHVTVGGLVDGIDLTLMAETVVRNDRRSNVVATKRFSKSVTVVGADSKLMVTSLNGLHLPDEVILHSADVSVGSKTFLGAVSISGGLEVNGRLDGVNVSDMALVNSNQRLCGEKMFRGRVTAPRFKYKQTQERVAAEKAVIHGSLHVTTAFNNNNVDDLLRDIIFKNETDLIFSAPVTFKKRQLLEGNVHVAGLINGMNLENDFVLKDHENIITGTKEFLSPVSFVGDISCRGTWNGVDVKELNQKAVRTNGDGIAWLYGKKTFVDGVTVQHFYDDGNATIKLEDLQTANVNVAKDIKVKGNVNSVKFGIAAARRITLSTDQTIEKSLTLGEDVEVDYLQVQGQLNGVDIGKLWNDVLWKNSTGKQVVTSQKKFSGRITAPFVTTKQAINGVSVADVERRTIRVAGGSIRGGRYQFRDVEVRGSATLSGDINGLSFSKLVEDSVMTAQSPVTIRGQKEFVDLNVKGNIWVAGKLNGLDLPRDVLTTNIARNVTGHYIFSKDIRASGNVRADGVVHVGTVSDGTELYVNKKVLFDGDASVDSLQTGGRLNGINLNRQHADLIAVADSGEMTETGGETKHLVGGAHFLKNLTVLGTINGFDYSTFFKQVVLNDDNMKVITAPKEFSASLSANHIIMEGNLVTGKTFNGNDIVEMANDDPHKSKVIGGSISIPKTITVYGNVTIENPKSGDNPPHGSAICTIAPKTTVVKELRVFGSVYASTVNEWNLTSLESDTLKWKSEEQVVTGKKTVTGTVRFNKKVTTERPKNLLEKPTGKDDRPWNDSLSTFVSDVTNHSESSFDIEQCPMSECDIADSIVDSLQQMAALSQTVNLVQRVDTFSNRASAFSVFFTKPNGTGLKMAVGFSDCHAPIQINSWNQANKHFEFHGVIELRHIRKIVPLVHRGRHFIMVQHLTCELGNRGEEALSLVDVMSVTIRRIDTPKFSSALLDFDVLQSGQGASSFTMLSLLNQDGILTIATLLSKGNIQRTLETVLPAGATHVRWLPESGTTAANRQRHIAVEFRDASKMETVIYEVLSTRWQRHKENLRPVLTLERAFLQSIDSFVTRGGEHGLVAWTGDGKNSVFQFYGFDQNSSRHPWQMREVLSDTILQPISVKVYASHSSNYQDVYLAINRGSSIDVHVQTSNKGGNTKLTPSAKLVVTQALTMQWFSIGGHLYLSALSEFEWSLYEFSGSSDIDLPKC